MKIHKEGYKIILVSFIILFALVFFLLRAYLGDHSYFGSFITIMGLLFGLIIFAFIVRFFRFPFRWLEPDDNVVYAPADGKIVVIETIEQNKYLDGDYIQISIFMSPLNVHVNFYPISGEVIDTDYYPGNKMVAWHPKSSELNEHSCTIIEDAKKRKVLVKQIAGAMARRIVCIAEKGDKVSQGDELGIIKFGSRVDVLLPSNAVINVELNQKVKAKETILAYFEE